MNVEKNMSEIEMTFANSNQVFELLVLTDLDILDLIRFSTALIKK